MLWIGIDEAPCIVQVCGVKHDDGADGSFSNVVANRAGQYDSAGPVQGFHVGDVLLPMLIAQPRPIRSVVGDHDKAGHCKIVLQVPRPIFTELRV